MSQDSGERRGKFDLGKFIIAKIENRNNKFEIIADPQAAHKAKKILQEMRQKNNDHQMSVEEVARNPDVDLNDIINVAAENFRNNRKSIKDWEEAWSAFEESANIRSSRITANIISLCQFSRGIADHFENVSRAIDKYYKDILDVSKFTDEKILYIYKNI